MVEQYRITKIKGGRETRYLLSATYGFLDIRGLGSFGKQAEARKFAKEHAAKEGQTKPIILT